MKPQYITIKNVPLNNNCPECYSREGLQLTFKQLFKETKFFKSITNETTENLNCSVCSTEIFPVMWTEDIERVMNYQKKAFIPKPASFKFKKLAWILFLTIDVLIILTLLVVFDVIKI
jgi:hypothetical protein